MTTSLNQDRAVVVADIGGTHIQLGHIIGTDDYSTIHQINSNCLRTNLPVKVLTKLVDDYTNECNITLDALVLGIPGLLDNKRDNISHCNNIPQLEGSGLKQQLSSELGCPVYLEQDIMLQVLGEWRNGAAKNSIAVFGIYFGTGIGTAYLRDGNPFQRGASTLQAGHIPVTNQGKLCPCGNTDCVEAYASGHTLKELASEHNVPIEQLFAVTDNAKLISALDIFVTYQAFLIASVITITEPDCVLIGGGIPTMPGYPHSTLEYTVHKHLQKPFPADTVELRWATHQQTAPLFGALALIDIYQNSHQG